MLYMITVRKLALQQSSENVVVYDLEFIMRCFHIIQIGKSYLVRASHATAIQCLYGLPLQKVGVWGHTREPLEEHEI